MTMTDREKAEQECWRVHHMHGIEHNAGWLSSHASDVAHHVRCLPVLPGYETEAEAMFDKAIADVADALLKLKVARSDLRKKRKTNLRLVSGQ